MRKNKGNGNRYRGLLEPIARNLYEFCSIEEIADILRQDIDEVSEWYEDDHLRWNSYRECDSQFDTSVREILRDEMESIVKQETGKRNSSAVDFCGKLRKQLIDIEKARADIAKAAFLVGEEVGKVLPSSEGKTDMAVRGREFQAIVEWMFKWLAENDPQLFKKFSSVAEAMLDAYKEKLKSEGKTEYNRRSV